jgi:tetratricopeptide (TPR) repeat protein
MAGDPPLGRTKAGIGLEDRTQRDLRDPGTLETQAADSRSSAPTVGRSSGVDGGPARGDQIGRFVVLGVLGAGGMGVVYSAYDPHLDRKVAIKLLSAEALAAADAHTRLLREAQAMAKIHHPNVIVVHEVGTLGEQVYLAMEFADGGTLRDWLTREKRETRDVLEVFLQAGRGLAAAHAVGLVHRDFKPDNVLLSSDGTVRVTDFGLVGVLSEKRQDTEESPPPLHMDKQLSTSGSTPLTADLTQTGAIMGTPRYMAPEQFRGVPSTERADQFSFCVALYEGLYGERPFAGATYAELCSNVVTGTLQPPPKGAKVPGWLRKVLLRGLSIDPASRYPSMKVLLAALSHDPRRLRTALVITGFGIVCAGGAAFALVMHPSHKNECAAGGEHVRAVWNPARRAALQDAFAKSNRLLAGPIFDKSAAMLDTWSKSWEDAYVGACEATRVHGEQSEHLLDLRMQCLAQRLDMTRATIDAATTGGTDAVDHALKAFSALPDIAPCADVSALLAAVPPPDQAMVAAQVAAVRTQIAKADAQENLGRYHEALALAMPALAAARATGYHAVVAEAGLQVGRLQNQLADPAASTTLRDAMHAAETAGDTPTMIEASAWLLFTLTVHDNQLDRAQEIAGFAEAAADRGHPPLDVYVRLQDTIAYLDETQGHIDAAQARYEKTLALAQEKLGPDHAGTLTTLNQLAEIYRDRGKLEEARKAYERVVESRERKMGKDHPDVAAALGNVGIVYVKEGKFDQAKQVYDRALAIDKAAYGPDHHEVANIVADMGSLYSEQGDKPKALDYYQQALAMREKEFGKDSTPVSDTLQNIGGALEDLGRHAEARAALERALAINDAHGLQDGVAAAGILNNLALVAEAQNQLDEARTLLERSRAIYEKLGGPASPDAIDSALNEAELLKTENKVADAEKLAVNELPLAEKAFGADHPHVGMLLVNLGSYQYKLGKPAEALVSLKRALAIFEPKLGKDHLYSVYAAAGIGETLVELHKPDEARSYLERAEPIAAKAGMDPKDVAELEAALKKVRSHR